MKTKTKKNIDKLNMEASYDFILFNVFMFFPVSFVSMLFLSSPHWLNMHNVELNKNRDKQDCFCSSSFLLFKPLFPTYIIHIYIHIWCGVSVSLYVSTVFPCFLSWRHGAQAATPQVMLTQSRNSKKFEY